MMTMRMIAFTVALTSAAGLNAQTPAPPRSAAAAPAAERQSAIPPAAEPYTYQSEGRRDPFVSLTGTGTDPQPSAAKGEGPAAMTIAEIAVRGIMQSRGTLVAMVSGPDHKTYIVHPGDKLLDGTIKSITPTGMVFVQDITDPRSFVKQREVSKLLHAVEGKP
jgi:Tfp pilus assembly protein PilP